MFKKGSKSTPGGSWGDFGPQLSPERKTWTHWGLPSEPKGGPGDPKGKPKGAKGCPKVSQKGPKRDPFLYFVYVIFWLRLGIDFLTFFRWFGMVCWTLFRHQFGYR